MAILREGITAGNEYIGQMRVKAKELVSISNDIIKYLNGNGNFQVFREGTEKGAAIYNNLNTCVNTIAERLVPTIERITTSTGDLLNMQQNLNRVEDSNKWEA